jgi:hypothetical protein
VYRVFEETNAIYWYDGWEKNQPVEFQQAIIYHKTDYPTLNVDKFAWGQELRCLPVTEISKVAAHKYQDGQMAQNHLDTEENNANTRCLVNLHNIV